MSASAVAGLAECPLRWFLGREVKAGNPAGSAAAFGLAVHEGIAHVINAMNEGRPIPEAAHLLPDFSALDYDATWQAESEHRVAQLAIQGAKDWLATRTGTLASEVPVDVVLPVAGLPEVSNAGAVEPDQVRIRGAIDVVETTESGVLIWDFKTRRSRPSKSEAQDNAQLHTYQEALNPQDQHSSKQVLGAGLVNVCVPTGVRDPLPNVSMQDPHPDLPGHSAGAELIRNAVRSVRSEEFPAQPSAACRTCDFQSSCPAKGERR